MKSFVLFTLISIVSFESFSNSVKQDSTTASIGLSMHLFPNGAPIGLEIQLKKSSNNFFGLGTGFTVYYLRQLPRIGKNLLVGIPLILNQNNIGIKEPDTTTNLYNFVSMAPLVGWQFVLGQKQNFKLRATYSPLYLSWIRDADKNISRYHYFHRLGFGAVYHLEGINKSKKVRYKSRKG